jgi:hypothetical protein
VLSAAVLVRQLLLGLLLTVLEPSTAGLCTAATEGLTLQQALPVPAAARRGDCGRDGDGDVGTSSVPSCAVAHMVLLSSASATGLRRVVASAVES